MNSETEQHIINYLQYEHFFVRQSNQLTLPIIISNSTLAIAQVINSLSNSNSKFRKHNNNYLPQGLIMSDIIKQWWETIATYSLLIVLGNYGFSTSKPDSPILNYPCTFVRQNE